jgi:chemotaxis signal transduction protein
MSIKNTTNKLDERNPLRAVVQSNGIDEPLALIDFGDVSFLVSSKDIFTLMSTQKMTASVLDQACGEIILEDATLPVFALNKALQLSSERPANHLTLVVLEYQARLFGLCCITLEKIDACNLHFFSVPVTMSSRKQPFSQFAVVNNRAAGVTSAANLFRLLQTRGVTFPELFGNEFVQEAG